MDPKSPAVASAYEKAKQALGRAHAPYSKLQVACAIKSGAQKEAVVGVNLRGTVGGGVAGLTIWQDAD